jgi:hypothetical protein
MPPARTQRIKAGIDLPALLKMQEPLTIALVRVRGNNKEPIMLEPREGHHVSNVGWTIAEVQAIDQEVIDVAGGGVYELQVTDASPDPQSTAWTFVIPVEAYPMKMPRTNPASAAYGYGVTSPPASPAGLAGYPSYAHAPVHPVHYGAATPIAAPPPPRSAPTVDVAPGTYTMQQELHRRDLAIIEERHRHERELGELRRQVEANRTPAGLDDRIAAERAAREAAERAAAEARAVAERALAEAQRAAAEAQARAEREAAERRAEERQRALEAQIAEDRRRADEKFTQLMAQMAAIAQRPAGPDPMMMLLIENQKATAEAAREAARIAAETEREKARVKAETDKEVARARAEEARINSESQNRLIERVHTMMAPNQMSPMDAARVVREASQSADQFTKTMVGSMNDMMDIQRNFLANMMQMAPQGEGVAGRIVSAIENVAQTVTQSQAQVAAAQAHAASVAQRAASWQPPPPVAPTGAAAPQPVDGGASGGLNGTNGAPQNGAAAPEPQAQPVVDAPASSTDPGPVRNGKTDAQWFGPALPDIQRLREGVTKYLVEVTREEVTIDQPKKGEPPTVVGDDGKAVGVSPLLAAQIILMSAAMIEQNKVPGVEAFDYFWKQQMYPALVDIMIPDAPPAYRTDVLRFMHRLFIGEPLFKDDDEPMFGIAKYLEEGDEVDEDEAPTPMPVPTAKPPIPVATGRRGR